MIEWFNQNQGFVTAILSFLGVVITIFLAYIAWKTVQISIEARDISKESKEISDKALEISQKHLKLTADLESERSRPYVLFNLTSENHITYAILKNYGLTAAQDVKVDISPKLERAFESVVGEESIISSQIFSLMPPDFQVKDSLGASPQFYQKYKEAKFEGKINYKDSFNKKYSESFSIDFDALRKRVWSKESSVTYSLDSIREEIESLKNVVEQSKF